MTRGGALTILKLAILHCLSGQMVIPYILLSSRIKPNWFCISAKVTTNRSTNVLSLFFLNIFKSQSRSESTGILRGVVGVAPSKFVDMTLSESRNNLKLSYGVEMSLRMNLMPWLRLHFRNFPTIKIKMSSQIFPTTKFKETACLSCSKCLYTLSLTFSYYLLTQIPSLAWGFYRAFIGLLQGD